MIKYFISYEDLLENNKLNREINFDSKELHIIRKTKGKKIRIEPFHKFFKSNSESKEAFEKLIQNDNYTQKGMLLVELSSDEKDLFNPLIIKTYKLNENKSFEKVYNESSEVNLINYNLVINMRNSELEKGEVIALMPCASNPENMYISLDRKNSKLNLKERRTKLKNLGIGCDLYFQTTDEELIERYKDSVTTIKESEFHTYELVEHKVFVIDSISRERMIDWTFDTLSLFNNICYNSIPVSITDDDDKYKLNIHNIAKEERKGYIITRDMYTLLYIDAIKPILKYINVYVYSKGNYAKIPFEDYLKDINILKYVKIPIN